MKSLTETAPAVSALSVRGYDVDRVRADFPILHQEINGHPLVYLDNGATTQKPASVVEAIERYYYLDNANVHRGVHQLSQRATDAFEGSREKLRAFINAQSHKEIILTSGTSESINLVVSSFGRRYIQASDEILITHMEHHSNIVPWQMLCEQTGAVLKVVPINEVGELLLDEYERLLSDKTRIVGITHVSNALGTINPLKSMIEQAHATGAVVLVDGAQAVAHIKVDVQALDCDFYAFSGHKLYGPTGIGVLYGKEALLREMPPYQGGGEMIERVSFEKTTYNDLPYKFEAGTPNIAGAIGLGAAVDYLSDVGLGVVSAHERGLLQLATQKVEAIDGLRIVGRAGLKCSILSFVIEGTHPSDIGTLLDQQGIAIRTGHHCAMPVMQRYCIPGTARASFAMYNSLDEVEVFVTALTKASKMLR